jgi:hypothetical protein
MRMKKRIARTWHNFILKFKVLKPEFRVIEVTSIDGNGKGMIKYKLEKKFIFFWVTAFFKCHYNTHYDWNSPVPFGARLIDRSYVFDDFDDAKSAIDKLEHPFIEWHHDCLIERVFEEYTLRDVFINKSNYIIWNRSRCYEFNRDLEELKRRINARTIKSFERIII